MGTLNNLWISYIILMVVMLQQLDVLFIGLLLVISWVLKQTLAIAWPTPQCEEKQLNVLSLQTEVVVICGRTINNSTFKSKLSICITFNNKTDKFNKEVLLVVIESSWCGSCHQLSLMFLHTVGRAIEIIKPRKHLRLAFTSYLAEITI